MAIAAQALLIALVLNLLRWTQQPRLHKPHRMTLLRLAAKVRIWLRLSGF